MARAAADGYTGVKIMTRIDLADPHTTDALELLGRVLEEARARPRRAGRVGHLARRGACARDADDIVHAAVIAHDLGAPLLKVPVPDAARGAGAPVAAIERIVASVGVPVLFLGGPHRRGEPDAIVDEAADVVAGGGAGLAIGRAVLLDPDPAAVARRSPQIIHG